MNTAEAIEICEGWFDYLDRDREKTKRLQELSAKARKGPEQAKEAQRELRQIDNQPKVYDGARLETAVRHLVASVPRRQ